MRGGEFPHRPPPSALSAAILWGIHQPIHNFLTFPNNIPTFIWSSNFSHFFVISTKKITVKFFFHPKRERFFDENGQNHFFLTNIGILCFIYVISMLWEIFWGALHVCMSNSGDVENLFHTRHIF